VVPVVEDDEEHPVGRERGRLGGGEVGKVRLDVPVADRGQVALGRAGRGGAVRLARGRRVDARAVFGGVAVGGRVALVVPARADAPGPDPRGVARVGDQAGRVSPVEGGDVAPGDGAPVGIPGGGVGPALDPGEQPFNPRPVQFDLVADAVHGPAERHAGAVGGQGRDEIVGTGQDEDVGLVAVAVARQPFIRFPPDFRQSDAPAEAERAISRPRVISEGKRRRKTGARRTERNSHRGGTCSGRRVDGEFLVKPPDCPAASWRGHRGQQVSGRPLPEVRFAVRRNVAVGLIRRRGRSGRRNPLRSGSITPWRASRCGRPRGRSPIVHRVTGAAISTGNDISAPAPQKSPELQAITRP